MNLYKVDYTCTCNERQCSLAVRADGSPVPNSPPPVCPYGKNVGHVLQSPGWQLKAQRFKKTEGEVLNEQAELEQAYHGE